MGQRAASRSGGPAVPAGRPGPDLSRDKKPRHPDAFANRRLRYSSGPAATTPQGLRRMLPLNVAALTVFDRSMAIVIGPTPPGTGAIAEAIALTRAKSTSPTIFPPT